MFKFWDQIIYGLEFAWRALMGLPYALAELKLCRLKKGDPAPDAELVSLEGQTIFLKNLCHTKWLVIFFGSYT